MSQTSGFSGACGAVIYKSGVGRRRGSRELDRAARDAAICDQVPDRTGVVLHTGAPKRKGSRGCGRDSERIRPRAVHDRTASIV